MNHIVMFSGGASSALVAERVIVQGLKPTLLYTNTHFEDEDNERFINDCREYLLSKYGQIFQFKELSDGRTPLQLFQDEGILGSDRTPICSVRLKSNVSKTFLKSLDSGAVYFGIDYKEKHRADRIIERYKTELPHILCKFPLFDPPYLTEPAFKHIKKAWGIEPPRMYSLNFPHANCGGRCVRGGVRHWLHLLRTWPDRYEEMEAFEAKFKGGKYTFMNGMSLRKLREDLELQGDFLSEAPNRPPCLSCMEN